MAAAPPFDAQAFMAAIIAAANAAATAAANAAVAPAVVVRPFARLPGLQNTTPLDFKKSEDFKVFSKSAEGFSEKFDLKDDKLGMFLAKIKDRSDIYNWIGIIKIPDDTAVARNILTNFGQLTLENCRAHVLTFLNVEGRNAQNDVMLYFLLVNSLTEEARGKAMGGARDAINYTNVAAVVAPATVGETIPSGIMLLKIIIGKSTVDTKAKVLLLRQEVATLSYKMISLKGDIVEFNQYAERKRDELLSRGQTVDELIAHLFTAYLLSPVEPFVRYIQAKKDIYEEDGTTITADELMALALVKHELIIQQTAAVNEGEDRIIAMRATTQADAAVDDQAARFIAMEASLRLMQERLNGAQGRGAGRNSRNKKSDQAHAWKKVKPKTGEPQVKVFSGRTYHWCRFHEAWTMHSPAECTLGNAQPAANPNPPAAANANQGGTYSAAANRALTAMMYDDAA